MIVLGLTGSIGMGKSTAASMLEHIGVPVHDSDAAVHDLMKPGAPGMMAIRAAFPFFEFPLIYKWNWPGKPRELNRRKLGELMFKDKEKRKKLESILHPLVRDSQREFIRIQRNMGRDIVALDIPLLFETGADQYVQHVINVTAPAHIQRKRVLSRPNMDEKKFKNILTAQMPDGEKNARADFVVQTGLGRAVTMKQLKAIIQTIRADKKHAA